MCLGPIEVIWLSDLVNNLTNMMSATRCSTSQKEEANDDYAVDVFNVDNYDFDYDCDYDYEL